MTKIDRVYHSYDKWECYHSGMYETTCFMDERALIQDCVSTLSCQNWLWECMTFVSHNWLKSSEHHLSNTHRNRQAYLGQSACCWLHGAPEYVTKKAWNELSKEIQIEANRTADSVLRDWEIKYKEGYFK